MVRAVTPHYVLFAESAETAEGSWRFTILAADGSRRFEVNDHEPDVEGDRLALLTAVRSLEALDQPSRVTLVTSSDYVRRGLLYGLDDWRQHEYTWERYGRRVPVTNRDLWRRLDRAIDIHRVDCRLAPSRSLARNVATGSAASIRNGGPRPVPRWRRWRQQRAARISTTAAASRPAGCWSVAAPAV